jgi:hypothetical protein
MRDHRQWQIPESPYASKIFRGWFYQLQRGQIISRRSHKRESQEQKLGFYTPGPLL